MDFNEFELIELFKQQSVVREDVLLGIGDDAAVLQVPQNIQLVVTTDTLVAGTHFLASTNPAFIAHKALVSNISDLAAMGAKPAWCSLALTLPKVDNAWLACFCQSFLALAAQYNIALIGGDTTRGSLAISITLHGFVQPEKALQRMGAKIDDWIFVTGTLGDSAAGLDIILQEKDIKALNLNEKHLIARHFQKSPRVEIGLALIDLASSCLDISDGLCADLKHILKINNVGALIEADKLPISEELKLYAKNAKKAAQIALTSGEEYELCFTISDNNLTALNQLSSLTSVKLTCIGRITTGNELKITWYKTLVNWSQQGWDHFVKNKK